MLLEDNVFFTDTVHLDAQELKINIVIQGKHGYNLMLNCVSSWKEVFVTVGIFFNMRVSIWTVMMHEALPQHFVHFILCASLLASGSVHCIILLISTMERVGWSVHHPIWQLTMNKKLNQKMCKICAFCPVIGLYMELPSEVCAQIKSNWRKRIFKHNIEKAFCVCVLFLNVWSYDRFLFSNILKDSQLN